MKSIQFRSIWFIVIVCGMFFILVNQSTPTELILIAQVANAIILPIMAIFLMYCMNHPQLGQYRNHLLSNLGWYYGIVHYDCFMYSKYYQDYLKTCYKFYNMFFSWIN